MHMKKWYVVMLLAGGAYYAYEQSQVVPSPERSPADAGAESFPLYDQQHSGQLVVGEGVVSRILPDDDDGSRHQRFILRLDSGQTLLIAHNIDVAPRISTLDIGDSITFRGEYEWNERGGVVHWTHHDPARRHPGGWLEHEGKRYE
jgi:hypothetical protein